MTERAKPFVAYVTPACVENEAGQSGLSVCGIVPKKTGNYIRPVVVTPLLPDDPRVGEMWLYADGGGPQCHATPVTITGAPFPSADGPRVPVEWADGGWMAPRVAWLRRPPVLKTFRLPGLVASPARYVEFQAESREAALASLAEGLEEVTDR